jgi:hypothetical protein
MSAKDDVKDFVRDRISKNVNSCEPLVKRIEFVFASCPL